MSDKLPALLLAAMLAGCANPYVNAKGEEPPTDLQVSCLRRAQFLVFFYDQMTIDDCLAFKGYYPAADKQLERK